MPPRPTILLLGGPNGSGKSTLARGLVWETFGIARFLNADTIARGLAAYAPDLAAVSAERAMLGEMARLAAAGESFAVETTLASKMYARWLDRELAGYRSHLAFVYTRSARTNVQRVAARVAHGGHDIPEANIVRRYDRSFNNFFNLYMDRVSSWEMIDNSGPTVSIAERGEGGPVGVYYQEEWDRLEAEYDAT